MEDLNDILNPPQQEEVAAEVGEEQGQEQQQEETGAAETQVAAETQQEVKEEKQADPAAALRAEIAAEKAALAKERERVRAKAAELEAKLAQPQQEPQKAPDFWEDPEARLASERQQFEQVLQRQRLDFSEMLAREKHADFNEKLEVFSGLVRENPALYQQMLKEANPAGWAYEQAAKHLRVKQLEEIGDPQEYENKLKEKFRQEWEAERAAEAERQKAAEVEATIAKKLPKSGFSELRSVGGSRDKAWSGPTPIGAIIGGGKK